jgi:hypothetical protein
MKYYKIKIPEYALNNLKQKQIKMQNTLKDITGKNKKIPMTKIITMISIKPLWIDDKELKNMSKWRRHKF